MKDELRERFFRCRKRLLTLLEKENFEFAKSSEGLIEVISTYPDIWSKKDYASAEPESYVIAVYSYLLCSNRREIFSGHTLEEAIRKLENWLERKETKR